MSVKPLRVAFVHPDLGLGGAERLIVDAAVELAALGNIVDIYTAYYDPSRCFEETKLGLFRVVVVGNWFPRALFGRAYALCAYVRCLLVALYICWQYWITSKSYDVYLVDQVSAVVPALQLFTPAKVCFYCHFPDLLLTQRSTLLKRIYRAPIDWLEERTTISADLVLVNSKFTQQVYSRTFKAAKSTPAVLYPCVVPPTEAQLEEAKQAYPLQLPEDLQKFVRSGPVFVSINRFERKKDLPLAIEALKWLVKAVPGCNAKLIIAGGYDIRVRENKEHLEELKSLTRERGLSSGVFFFPSFSDRQRALLLAAAAAVLYTPQNEHFGIVPIEAMASGKPVVACNSGGPTESVVDSETGFLCEPTAECFGSAMKKLLSPELSLDMGKAARAHTIREFSRASFGTSLNRLLRNLSGAVDTSK